MDQSFKIAETLNQLRTEKGLSFDKLSEALKAKYNIKISSDSLANYEISYNHQTKAGKNMGMRVEYLICLADYYGVSTDFILGKSKIRSSNPNLHAAVEYTGLDESAVAFLHSLVKSDRAEGINKIIQPEDCLKGLSLLISNGRISALARDIMHFSETVKEYIALSNYYRDSSPVDNPPDFYKWKLTADEEFLAIKLKNQITSDVPDSKGAFEVLVGRKLIEYQRRAILDSFEEEVRRISSYDEFNNRSVNV